MPCNSDHMDANSREVELSKVATLLDELDGKDWNADHWHGYHPRIYCKSVAKDEADAMVAELCRRIGESIGFGGLEGKYSLELQMWWRDHLRADYELSLIHI